MVKNKSEEEFSNEVLKLFSDIKICLNKYFVKKGISINETEQSFFIFQSALIQCNAQLYLFKGNEENQKWRKLYKTHEAWKRMALADPLTSDHLKD
jgi:hypothetical protein